MNLTQRQDGDSFMDDVETQASLTREDTDDVSAIRADRKALTWLTGSGFVLGLIYAAIVLVWMQPQNTARGDVIWVVGLYWGAAVVWLVALRCALQIRETNRSIFPLLFVFAICFRAIQMFGTPILELDVYRYLWDGIVTSHGSSPYQHSPAAVLANDVVIANPDLKRLADIAALSPTHHAIASTVHFPEYTTIYPPVSQAVFAAAMWIVPDAASVSTHLLAMRLALLTFDIATLLAVIGLIRLTSIHVGWAIAYAWNPLVIKEIANSAHVDAIAVCFTVVALFVVLWSRSCLRMQSPIAVLAAVLLALGVGAKLYPVLLAPIIFLVFAKSSIGKATLFGSAFVLASGLLLVWMVPQEQADLREVPSVQLSEAQSSQNQQNGLVGFLSRWRMNDLVFSLIYENANLRETDSDINRPWYSVLPNSWRVRLHSLVGAEGIGGSAAFRLARFATLGIFGAAASWMLFRLWRSPCDSGSVLEVTFLVLVIFLLLQPTFNPWYGLWAMPFVCFVSNRGWLLLGPLLFCYYLRFWFKVNDIELTFGAFTYRGAGVFDYCVVWFEYAAIGLSLIAFWFVTRRANPALSQVLSANPLSKLE